MNWELKEPITGDMVRVKIGSIYHYGVFVSEDEIIQFGLAPQVRQTVKDVDVEVCASTVDAFLCGGFLEVATLDKKEKKNRRAPQQTVAYARGRLGEKGYNILYNNCEHFAYECVTGERKCTQAENVRNLFRSIPIVDVFIATLPPQNSENELYPKERKQEIETCSNERVKRQKYYVWKLLEYALQRSFGLKIQNLTFTKQRNGKWTCPNCCFSLSHSENALAVAVSRQSVGVDIERIAKAKEGFIQKVLDKEEARLLKDVPNERRDEFLIGKWTEKESIFKAGEELRFQPAKIHTAKHSKTGKKITVAGEEYMLSVACEHVDRVRYFENVDLNKI